MAITSAFQADDAGSIPAARSKADIAQLVERTLGKGEVGSSNLPISTIILTIIHLTFFFNQLCWEIEKWQKKSLNVRNRTLT